MPVLALVRALLAAEKSGRGGDGHGAYHQDARGGERGWTATTNRDAQWAAGGVRDLSPARRVLYRVSEEVMKLAVEREDVARTLLAVKNLTEPPSALLRPGILLPVLARTARRRKTRHRTPTQAEDELLAES